MGMLGWFPCSASRTVNRHILLIFLFIAASSFADPGFNRCKKFSTYPATPVFKNVAVQPGRSDLPAPTSQLLSARLGLNPDAKADYAGQFKVLEIQEDPGYHYYFWDLKAGYILSGPVSEIPALWRLDSRLFIVPASAQDANDFNHLGYIGNDPADTASYYLLNDDQKYPGQTLLETLNCSLQ